MARIGRQAPELDCSAWLNADSPLALASLRGRAVAMLAFQMLCPGCVTHALPQLRRLRRTFDPASVAVLGLHTVFEHHEAQGGVGPLKAFLREQGLDIPVGIDAHDPGEALPRTMKAYGMQGTPTLVLIDPRGRLRAQVFGHVDDMKLGAVVAGLAAGAAT